MREITRRNFLNRSTKTVVALGVSSMPLRSPARAVPASGKVTLAAIGVGGRCSTLIRGFSSRDDVHFATLCDVYPRRDTLLAMHKHLTAKQDSPPKIEQNFRRVLDDKSIDAVVIATPDHWHGPLAVFACQAGKDVYVEKPPCHNIWEGQRMVEAARRYKRVVQVGTQNRSAPYVQEALKLISEGEIGQIPLCKVGNLKSGGPYDAGANGAPPDGMDYDIWLGPAPERPYNQRTVYGGGWHKYWDFSGGDMADDGIHQLDIARWLLGKEFPTGVHASGGKLAFKDAGEVPDTQVVTFDFDGTVMTFELTGYPPYMKKAPDWVRNGDFFPYWLQNSERIEFYGTKKLLILGRHGGGWQIFTDDGKVEKQMFGRVPDAPHQENFIKCIQSRDRPNADVEEGHRSSALVHLGNISYRLGGRKLLFDPKTQTFAGDAEANRLLKRDYRSRFAVPEVV